MTDRRQFLGGIGVALTTPLSGFSAVSPREDVGDGSERETAEKSSEERTRSSLHNIEILYDHLARHEDIDWVTRNCESKRAGEYCVAAQMTVEPTGRMDNFGRRIQLPPCRLRFRVYTDGVVEIYDTVVGERE